MLDWLLYSFLGLDPTNAWVKSLEFFIYDSVKILLLLFVMITVVGFIRTYVSRKNMKAWLSGRKYGSGNLMASGFGALTPFCSCSSIPIFLSFLKAGVPLGVTFSFLITSPLVNEYLVVLMLGFFGWKITLAYVISGVLIGVLSGLVLGRMNLSGYIEKDMVPEEKEKVYNSFKERLRFGLSESTSIVRKLWVWILVGVGVGAVIHNYVPAETVQSLVGGSIAAVPLAVLLGVPMYGSCAAIVPIAVALFNKGLPLGTALAFMMATAALSFPEAVILRRAMKLKLILIFFGIVALGILITGYVFNVLQYLL
ncbi:MAG: permease [Nanobdellota archaeon]